MLPVTDAEKTLITKLTEFRKNALEALEKISDGFKLATHIANNEEDSNIRRVSIALHDISQLLSDFRISEDSDSLWISCKANQKLFYYRDSAGTPINVKNLMFALMSFELALTENINILYNISNSYISSLHFMQEALHAHITDYVDAT